MQLSDMHGAGRVKFFPLKIVSKAKFHKIRQEYIFLFREISENKSYNYSPLLQTHQLSSTENYQPAKPFLVLAPTFL